MSDYFTQRVECGTGLAHVSRYEILKLLCTGKRVLHIGCADYPVFDPQNSLHLFLQEYCDIDGVDEHIEEIAPHCKGSISTAIDYDKPYDIVLVPEVLEHVLNAGQFLSSLDRINAPQFVITVPCAYQCRAHFKPQQDSFTEIVHPDHKCWYSPYTLQSIINAATPWSIECLELINNISVMAICNKSLK
jgi:hypothetical protein